MVDLVSDAMALPLTLGLRVEALPAAVTFAEFWVEAFLATDVLVVAEVGRPTAPLVAFKPVDVVLLAAFGAVVAADLVALLAVLPVPALVAAVLAVLAVLAAALALVALGAATVLRVFEVEAGALVAVDLVDLEVDVR